MATYEERLTALEKDAATMKHDIVYKLDDTNSAVTIIKGIAGTLAQDVKVIRSQMKTMDIRLDGIDTHLVRLEEQQNEQAQGIKDVKRHLDTLEEKFDQRFASLEGTLEQVLWHLTSLTKKPE
jgi:flagellar capping protein FliD